MARALSVSAAPFQSWRVLVTILSNSSFAHYERLCDRGQDNVQELIDAFWEHPYAFSMLAHHRYPDDVIHMFAGRVYNETPLPGLLAMRSINKEGRKKRVAHEVA